MSLSSHGTAHSWERRRHNPIHSFLLGGAVAFFFGSLLSDWAYFSSLEIQWKNFASWLLIGGLVFGGFALLGTLIELALTRGSRKRAILYFLILLGAWILGFVDELVHAKDAFATMPDGLILSASVVVLAIAATVLGSSTAQSDRFEK